MIHFHSRKLRRLKTKAEKLLEVLGNLIENEDPPGNAVLLEDECWMQSSRPIL